MVWVMRWGGEEGRGGDVEPRKCHDLSLCLVSVWSLCLHGSGECPVRAGGQAGSHRSMLGRPGRLRGEGACQSPTADRPAHPNGSANR